MIRNCLLAATFLGILAPAAGPAVAQQGFQPGPNGAPPAAPCLRQRNIYDFQIVPGNRSLVVTDIARRRYRLNFVGKCYNLQHQFGLRFKTFGVGSLACLARGDSVLMRDPVGPNQCIIRDVQYQTPGMDRDDFEAARAMERR